MNIISNDCAGAVIYNEILKEKYANPFMWTRIPLNDYLYLIQNWKNINFKRYDLLNNGHLKKFFLKIDNKIIVKENHMIFSENYIKPTKIGVDIYYNKIWEYIVNKYDERLLRMNEKPIFLGHFDYPAIKKDSTITKEKLIELCQYIIDNKIPFLLLSQIDVPFNETNTFKKVIFKEYKKEYAKGPCYLINERKDEIKLKLNLLKKEA